MQMKLYFLGTLFVVLSGIAQAATNMVLSPAGYIPAGTTLTLNENSMNYFATMQANAQNQMELVQKQMLQTQFQNGLVSVAQSSFADFQRERKKGKRTMTVKTTEPVPYYEWKENTTDDDTTPVEKTAVPPTASEAVKQIAPVQQALDKVSAGHSVKPCPEVSKVETPTYSPWDEYIKNIQETAASAKPPVPAKAVQKTVDFLKANQKRLEKTLRNRNYVVINDFTVDSTNKRMMVLNLKTKKVERYLVSHGHGKPENSAMAPGFSNTYESELTPPGFFAMMEEAHVKRPIKDRIQMDGLEPSNANARSPRGIIFHGGPVSEDEVKAYGMLGTSKGCPQVSRSDYAALSPKLQGGVLMYNFTP
jgi:hypothetical protein